MKKCDRKKNRIKKLEQTLQQVFEAGFKFVFEKRTDIIEKSYSKDEKSMFFNQMVKIKYKKRYLQKLRY